MFSANYTWGKVLDNVTEGGLGDYLNTNGYGGLYSGVQDIQNQRGDRGPSEFDATTSLCAFGAVDLAFSEVQCRPQECSGRVEVEFDRQPAIRTSF